MKYSEPDPHHLGRNLDRLSHGTLAGASAPLLWGGWVAPKICPKERAGVVGVEHINATCGVININVDALMVSA
jgi:hypothetical protein